MMVVVMPVAIPGRMPRPDYACVTHASDWRSHGMNATHAAHSSNATHAMNARHTADAMAAHTAHAMAAHTAHTMATAATAAPTASDSLSSTDGER